ncbi:hypothetical protein EXN66_Car002282 [Channa argus]|uniref:Interleukin-1 beta n=1 Tax=Channa argus TaxID=215402 RepID=A0A6G1P8I3_CHAAH|nr:hypothetical protein EXN66_Car002282 [Channa argus]KAK2920019.1 hypothetical protein Q8A73_002223 [Channa argus]
MDLNDTLVKGGVLIVHQIRDGKHQYEVDNVVKYKDTTGEKMFVRRGDKLMQINGMDLQDRTPEELAQLLAQGNPLLVVHKASRIKENHKQSSPAEEILHPVSKEYTLLSFSLEMKTEENLEDNEVKLEDKGKEDVCQSGNKKNEEEGDLLIVAMKKTSISVVTGRGCDRGSPCEACHGTGCSFNDVVMVTESSTVTLVPRGSYRQDRPVTAFIEHLASHYYLRAFCSQKILYASPNPEKITIYHYKSNFMDKVFRGMPVVLNFTDSNCFVRCCKDGGRVFLEVETYELQKLKQISEKDELALSFVFYMKSDKSKNMKFESALHHGWFIQINKTTSPTMQPIQKEDPSFLFVIRK